jgi:hypothetical protein
MVNKEKALGSKKCTDRMLTERLMRASTPMNYNVVALIHQDPTYKRMIFDDVLRRILNHELYIEEANHIKNLYKGVTTTKKQEIALKASKKSKNRQVVVESSSEEEEEEEEEDSSECDARRDGSFHEKIQAVHEQEEVLKRRQEVQYKLTTKRICYNCGKHGNFITKYSFEHRDDDDDKKKSKFYKKDKDYKRSDKPYKEKTYGEAHIGK